MGQELFFKPIERAVLAEEAIDHMIKLAGGYCNLEYNIELGTRGSRCDVVKNILKTQYNHNYTELVVCILKLISRGENT